MKRGKKYVEAAKAIDRGNLYDVADAVSLVKKTAVAKFDETVEAHIRTGCDGRHACLLYTSDAADDGYSVDLGGRRIIKKIFFKQKTAYEISEGLVGSEMCIRDRMNTMRCTRSGL